MRLNLERVRANVRAATTEDLLDRATVYRAGMEPAALELIDEELQRRGIGAEELRRHEEQRQNLVMASDGLPLKCEKCPRPAVEQTWGWHRLWGVLPVFPRRHAYCELHRPGRDHEEANEE
jgi:hypothetical protein